MALIPARQCCYPLIFPNRECERTAQTVKAFTARVSSNLTTPTKVELTELVRPEKPSVGIEHAENTVPVN